MPHYNALVYRGNINSAVKQKLFHRKCTSSEYHSLNGRQITRERAVCFCYVKNVLFVDFEIKIDFRCQFLFYTTKLWQETGQRTSRITCTTNANGKYHVIMIS